MPIACGCVRSTHHLHAHSKILRHIHALLRTTLVLLGPALSLAFSTMRPTQLPSYVEHHPDTSTQHTQVTASCPGPVRHAT